LEDGGKVKGKNRPINRGRRENPRRKKKLEGRKEKGFVRGTRGFLKRGGVGKH